MYTLSVVLLGLFIVPWFLLLDTGTGWGIMLATIVAFGILWAPVIAVLGTLCSEIFSANVRYTDHPRLPAGRRAGRALRRLSPPVCWRNMTVTGGRWPFIWALRWRFAPGDILRQPDEVRAGHGLPGGKRLTAARRATAPTIPPGGAACAGPGEITPRGNRLSQSGKHGPGGASRHRAQTGVKSSPVSRPP
ncbi:hypothetical protein J4734_22110 [Klebsiella pneumoniae]|uniref:Uncharacterized protein n=1 Tax=Klebsiella pneumoniae TaxID=573 RepID=A0A939SSM3_KLEPN|nr:hypothetical protein [Klebsiella pneumoniae]